MFCMHCGKELPGCGGIKFCPYCGGNMEVSAAVGSHAERSNDRKSINISIPEISTLVTNTGNNDHKRLLLMGTTVISAMGILFPLARIKVSVLFDESYTIMQISSFFNGLKELGKEFGFSSSENYGNENFFHALVVVALLAFIVSAACGVAFLYNSLMKKDYLTADQYACRVAVGSLVGVIMIWAGNFVVNTGLNEATKYGLSSPLKMTPWAFLLLAASAVTFVLAKKIPVNNPENA
uniref:Uncharacterized protein n=1 Tax=Eubacterium cellulosolvens (strain ATCC 43171 / JCM 9499 / 6) TaxID=633697 RepID=I5AXD6_EUBC6